MKPNLLFVLTGDPRQSARPAEAIRIAAGVGAWKRAEITLYLRDTAVLVLSEFADDLVDEDNYTRYRPLLREWGRPVLVQRGAPLLADIGEAALPFEEIDDTALAALVARNNCVLHF
jgi:hypothetical protein